VGRGLVRADAGLVRAYVPDGPAGTPARAAVDALSFMLLMPDGIWQAIMAASGIFQMVTLLADSRWRRCAAAFLAALFYAWITENQILFSYGLHPVILLSAGWIGVNMFAVSRAIGGLR
jgi:hypothetical protein